MWHKNVSTPMEVNLGTPRRPRKIRHICICNIGKAFSGSMPFVVLNGISEFTSGGKSMHVVTSTSLCSMQPLSSSEFYYPLSMRNNIMIQKKEKKTERRRGHTNELQTVHHDYINFKHKSNIKCWIINYTQSR